MEVLLHRQTNFSVRIQCGRKTWASASCGRPGFFRSLRKYFERAAYGRCRTKTGTISAVSNLSGYCFNRSGRTMIFSILMNSVSDLSLAHDEQDRIAAAVASY